MKQHTPTPWRWYKDKRYGPSGNVWADLFIIESGTRKCMAILEVSRLNTDKQWRAKNPDTVAEHAQTLKEVEANAKLICHAANHHAALVTTVRDLVATLQRLTRQPQLTVEEACRRYTNLVGTSLYNGQKMLEQVGGKT